MDDKCNVALETKSSNNEEGTERRTEAERFGKFMDVYIDLWCVINPLSDDTRLILHDSSLVSNLVHPCSRTIRRSLTLL